MKIYVVVKETPFGLCNDKFFLKEENAKKYKDNILINQDEYLIFDFTIEDA